MVDFGERMVIQTRALESINKPEQSHLHLCDKQMHFNQPP